MRRLIGKHVHTSQPVEVITEQGRITEITSYCGTEAGLPWIAPGLFDLQVNGAEGIWFSDEHLSVDQVEHVLKVFRRHGVARLFPTLITNSQAALRHGFSVIRQACESIPWIEQMIAGCHLEGPYISREDGPRGAHPQEHVRPASPDEFAELQEASGGRIRLLTLAPEVPGAVALIGHVTATGVRVAIGHTAAGSSAIAAAVDAGATLSTHLGNGCHGMLPRHPNYLWDQLAEPRLTASLITDGHHIPANFVRTVLRCKGTAGVVITCDSSGLAGCPPGVYPAAGTHCEVLPEGRIVVAGQSQYLAGSGAFTEECVAKMVQMTGVSLGVAWEMAHGNPARLCGVAVGTLDVGEPAELVTLRQTACGALQIEESLLLETSVFPTLSRKLP